MFQNLFFLVLFFLRYNSISSTITISKISDLVSLNYEFPSLIPDNWINEEKIYSMDPYKCHYQPQQQNNSLITSHSCELTIDLSMGNFYNYGFLHASKTVLKEFTRSKNNYNSFLVAIPFRLSLAISRADTFAEIAADIYVTFTMKNVFKYVLHFNESVRNYDFQYDFSLPMPSEDVLTVFDRPEEISSIDFSNNNRSLELQISSYIIQDGNVLPNQNFFWNHRMLKLRYSNLSINYIDSA